MSATIIHIIWSSHHSKHEVVDTIVIRLIIRRLLDHYPSHCIQLPQGRHTPGRLQDRLSNIAIRIASHEYLCSSTRSPVMAARVYSEPYSQEVARSRKPTSHRAKATMFPRLTGKGRRSASTSTHGPEYHRRTDC